MLALVGGADPQDPVENLSDLKRHFPDSRTMIFPHVGHSFGIGGCLYLTLADFVDRGTTKGLDTTGCDGAVVVPPFDTDRLNQTAEIRRAIPVSAGPVLRNDARASVRECHPSPSRVRVRLLPLLDPMEASEEAALAASSSCRATADKRPNDLLDRDLEASDDAGVAASRE